MRESSCCWSKVKLLSSLSDVDASRCLTGTVLLHFGFAAKQDQSLGKALLDLAKSKQVRVLAPEVTSWSLNDE